MKKIILIAISLVFFGELYSQYCSNGGPSSTFDSNVESVFISGENNTSINYTGCPGVSGVENQSSLMVDLVADSTYTMDVQFGTCGGNYNSAGEVWIDWNQNTIFESTESIGSWSGTPPTSLSNFTFTVPPIAFTGISGIRVMQYEGGSLPLDPCASFTWGSVVDFSANISGGYTPTCPAPPVQFMAAINITASNATLQWVAAGVETEWIVEHGLAGFSQGTGTSSLETTTSVPITGLSPITTYDFYVQAICGPGDTSLWSGPFSFITPCAALTPAQLEDFSGGFPPNTCWEVAGDGDPGTGPQSLGFSNWYQDGFGNVGNTGAVGINLYTTGKNEWILTPQYDLTTGGPFQVELDFGVFTWPTTSPGTLGSDDRVEVLISRDGGVSWSGLANYNNNYVTSPNGNHEIIPLPNDTGIVQFAIWASEGTVDDPEDNDVMIDNFAINAIPSCPQPLYINAFNILPDSASLTWTVFGTDTSWIVYLTPTGVTPDTSHLTLAANDTVTFSGLSSNTYYDFYVQGICSNNDTSSLTGPFTFVTSCLPISSPYFQNFDNSTAPYFDQCWSSLNNTGVSFANVQANDNSFNPVRSLPNSIQFYNSSGTSGELFFVSPMISDLDSTKRIRFHLNSNSSSADLIVGTMSDPSDPTTFTLYETVANSSFNNGWQEIIVNFNNYTGTDIYIALGHGLNSSFNYIFLDDFHYEDIPSCVKPSALTASNITANNADISWTPGGAESLWQIQWGTIGFALGSGVFDTTSATNYSLTTLNASMGYDFYIRSICNPGDTSYWNGPLTFNTLIQGPVGITCISGGNAGLIYLDDLESQGAWTGNFGTGTTTGQWNVNSGSTGSFGTGPDVAHSGSNYFYYETSGTNPTSGSIVSPLIDLSTATDDAELSFWLHAYGAEIGTLNLGIGTTPTGPFTNVFSSSNELQTSNAAPYQNVGVNLGSYIGQQIYLEFSYTSGNSYTGDVAIDLIEVTSCISCPSPLPSSLSVNSISADSVNLSWQGAPTQNSWLVYLVPDTSTLANTTPILVTNDTVNLAVNPNLNYNFYVNGICSAGDTSILAGPVTFSTPCVSFVSFPYNEDFSIWPPNCWDLSGGTQSCVHYNNSSAEASFWSWQAGNYAYMTSPVFDVSNMVSPELLFDWSHQYNSSYPNDALEVLVSGNGGVSWTQIWYKTATDLESNDGATTGSPGTFISSGRLSLSPFGTSLQIRFNFASGYGPDCFIDNVEIKEAPQNDVGVVVANLPTASTGCEVDSSIVTATIFNFGYLPQSGFTIQYSLNGTPFVETIFDTLQPGDSLLYTFTLPVDLTQDGTYSFDFTTNLPNDDNTANDAYGSTLTFQNYYTPFAPTVTDDTVCINSYYPNGNVATLTASGPSGVTFDWFDAAGGFIGTGDTMTTDTINTSTSVFVAYQELAPGNMGATNNTFGGGGYYNFFTEGLMFDVYNDLTIDSVTIYPSDTGTVGIIIQSVLGSTIFNGNYTITAPVNTISGHKVPIGVNIPAGLAYGMYVSAISPGTLSLYRNTTNASYPYDYGNVASITQASNGSTDFYFFFYNWDISTISCYSDMQEAVVYVDPCTNIKENNLGEFNISPNPNNGSFEIYMTNITATTEIEILDLNGKIIYNNTISNKNQNINIENISRGVYIVKANQNGNIKTKKLIIQ